MKRGEIWTAAGGSDYTSKPRPVVIVQDDRFSETDSITVCPLTSDAEAMLLFRIAVDPSDTNGLATTSRLMADKIATVPKQKLGRRVGRIDDETMLRLGRAITVFLGIAG